MPRFLRALGRARLSARPRQHLRKSTGGAAFTFALLLACAAGARAAGAIADATLSLSQAIDLALRQHPSLRAAEAEVFASQGALDQAGALANPELNVSMEDTQHQTRTTAVQWSQRLELGGKRQARQRVAERVHEAAHAALTAQRNKLRADVRETFVEVLLSQTKLASAARSRDVAGQALEVAGKRVVAGRASPVEESRARIAVAGAEAELAQARAELAVARIRLAAWCNVPASRLPAVGGTLGLPAAAPSDAALSEHVAMSPEVMEAGAEAARRREVAGLERAKVAPDVMLAMGVQRNNELGRTQPLLGLSVPLPLFDRNEGVLREALARADQAQDQLAAITLRVQADVLAAAAQLDSAREQAQMLERHMLPQAEATFNAATTGFAAGKFGFLDVLDAQRTLLQASDQHLRAVRDAHRAAAALERLLGPVTPFSSQPPAQANEDAAETMPESAKETTP